MRAVLEPSDVYSYVLALLRGSELGSKWLEISAEFGQADVYLAGGSLRDLLLTRKADPKDFDFFLGGRATDEILARLAHEGALSRGPFGSPRWSWSEGEKVYCDVIPIRSFYNGLWPCEDIIDVLNQFDFTANAMAIHLRTGVFFDSQNGRRDLSSGLMRAIRFDYPDEPINPSFRLTRPAVVWFRILHYAALLGLTIEPVTRSWLVAHSQFAKQYEEFSEAFFPLHPESFVPLGTPGQHSWPR